MESQAATDARLRLNSICVFYERERFPVYFWRSYVRDMRLISQIDALTTLASEWSVTRGPSYTQFRVAALKLNQGGLDFKVDTFEQLDMLRNRDRAKYDSAPFTRVCEMIEAMGLTRLKAYALLVHWNHHQQARENLFQSLEPEVQRVLSRAEKLGVTPEVLEIQKKIKAKKTELRAIERKLEPAQSQLRKYEELVQELTESHSSICDQIESLEHQMNQVQIIK